MVNLPAKHGPDKKTFGDRLNALSDNMNAKPLKGIAALTVLLGGIIGTTAYFTAQEIRSSFGLKKAPPTKPSEPLDFSFLFTDVSKNDWHSKPDKSHVSADSIEFQEPPPLVPSFTDVPGWSNHLPKDPGCGPDRTRTFPIIPEKK